MSKYLPGVYKPKGKNTYRAKAYRDAKVIYLGSHKTEQEAHEAYLKFIEEFPPATRGNAKVSRSPTSKRKINYDPLRAAWYGV